MSVTQFLKLAVYAPLGLVATTTAFAAGDSSGGLPQLDIATWPNQLLWLVVTFTILFLLMNYMVTPRIGAVLEARRDKIAGDLDKAREADAEAKEMQVTYEKALASARADASDKAQAATKAANDKAAAAEAELAKKLAKKLATAEKKLATMRDEAMANLNDVATEAAQDTIKQLVGIKATKAEVTKQVKAAAKAANA
ncbi:MAG: F0F1 ATP synthase subunit B' [Candidatus Puniceispirillaceae bacterium]